MPLSAKAACCSSRRGLKRYRVRLADSREDPWHRRHQRRGSGKRQGVMHSNGLLYAPSYGCYYDIYVHSNQPDKTVTATASNGASHSYVTDSTGYADVYLYAANGDSVKVTVGTASCSTTA